MANNPKKILLVEDEESLRTVMVAALTQRGFLVEVAVDGQEALIAIRAQAADLILLDIVLPKMSGLEILETLTPAEKACAPIIIFSVSTAPITADKLKALGVAGSIVKSDMTPEDIILEINKHLS
ncbi:MAG: response regulator [Patescibacteria group bacterium]|mgnify:FL=1